MGALSNRPKIEVSHACSSNLLKEVERSKTITITTHIMTMRKTMRTLTMVEMMKSQWPIRMEDASIS
jgi:hypothetical protein